jgi:hypothetical protein
VVGFIDSLPHALIDPVLYDPFWYWCVMPTIRRQIVKRTEQEIAEANERGAALERGENIMEFVYHQKSLRWTKDEEYVNETKEQPQISAAVVLLKLLPVANLSLLVYLFNFFTQLPLCPDNGVQPADITRIFGHSLMGGKSKSDAMQLMLWLLQRWPKIAEDLFAQSTTTWEADLINPAQPVDDLPSPTYEGLLEALEDYSRILESKYTKPVRKDHPRKGSYQFAAEGFPASDDLYALSQVVAGENYEQSVHSKIQRRSTKNSCYAPPMMTANGGYFFQSDLLSN